MKVREPYQDWACSCYATLGIAYQATYRDPKPGRYYREYRTPEVKFVLRFRESDSVLWNSGDAFSISGINILAGGFGAGASW